MSKLSRFTLFLSLFVVSTLGCSSGSGGDRGPSGGSSGNAAAAGGPVGGAGSAATPQGGAAGAVPASGAPQGGAAGAPGASGATQGGGGSGGGLGGGAGSGGATPGGASGTTSGAGSGGAAAGAGAQAGSGGVDDAASGSEGTPTALSQAGLFESDMTTLASGVRPFGPQYQLWADGATKRRWIWLPEGSQINTSDMEYWEFPVGTRVYKEFSQGDRRIETRRLEKRENASWSRVSYLWRDDQSDADAVPLGAENAAGTEHDIPSSKSCGTCHLRMPDKILGFSAIQLAHDDPDATAWTLARLAAEGRLSSAPPASAQIPGDDTARAALGYLHANCGHCHNPRSTVTSRIELNLWLRTDSLGSVEATPSYQSTVSKKPLSETQPPAGSVIVAPGSPETSTLFLRIGSRGADYSMPPLGTEMIDPNGHAAVEAWIRSLAQ